MTKRKVFFINRQCEIISNEQIKFHELLADHIVDSNEELKEKFKNSKIDNKTLFLILDEGYLAGTDSERYKEISFSPSNLTQKEMEILLYYKEEQGYELHNMLREYEMMQERNKKKHEEEQL